MAKPKVLYISYSGMLEPLGQSQVIAYLERLSDEFALHLISFEKPADWADGGCRSAIATRLAGAGIAWHPLTYHKRPSVLATLFDIVQGTILALWLRLRHGARIIHARSYVPALAGLIVKRLTGARLLFDMRGLWVDERVEGGIWRAGGRIQRAARRLERSLLRGGDHIVTLTHASRPAIETLARSASLAPVSVIPTCADLERFAPGDRRPERFTLGHVGSVGMNRMFGEVLACFRVLRERRPDARLLVVNRGEHHLVREALRAAEIPEEAIELTEATHDQMVPLIRRMSAGAAINRPSFGECARAPTRLAEYLGCGVPCLGNVGIGDMETILEREGAGVALRDFTDAERRRAVDRLLAIDADPATAAHCRAVALEHFSLDAGVRAYRAIYAGLAA
jgi:glycosyltransferase involved in cell wall biosynthesis